MTSDAQHLDPRIRTVWRVGAVLALGPLVVVATVLTVTLAATDVVPVALAMVVLVALLVASTALAWLGPSARYRHWTYRIDDEALELQHGVAFRTRSVIPYFRVQHVDTSQGPIERRLGLTNLTIHTASAASDASLPGLATADAERVRQVVLARSGVGDAV